MSLTLFVRVLHIAATCTSLGGLFYARMVLWPTLDLLPEPQREHFLARTMRRFGYIKWGGVIVVAITGMIQWLQIFPYVVDTPLYIACFVLKMIGAVGLFGITFMLALPLEKLQGMQRRRGFWSALNIVCGLTILIGAGLMRSAVKIYP